MPTRRLESTASLHNDSIATTGRIRVRIPLPRLPARRPDRHMAAIRPAMFLIHRILGPVFRMQSHMQSILDGKTPSELSLRDTDRLTDVVSTYNALLHSLDLIEPKPMENADGEAENADSS